MKNLKLFLSGFRDGARKFGHVITGIINFVLLTLVYFIGVGITSVFAKIFRKRFLDVRLNKKLKSYWVPLNLSKKPTEEYYRQF